MNLFVPSTSLSSLSRPAQPTPTTMTRARGGAPSSTHGPAFSSLGRQTSRLMEPLFRATQEYVWELMLLDVVALWIPRIWNALERGSVRTSLNQVVMDPKHQDKPSLKQFGTFVKKNLQGLNWPNGLEETWREIQSAPMLLLVQSMFFGIAMEHDTVKRGILLAKSDLEPMNKAFGQFLSQKGSHAESLLTQKGGLHRLTKHFFNDITQAHFKDFGANSIQTHFLKDTTGPMELNWLDAWRVNRGKGLPVSNRQLTLKWIETEFGRQAQAPNYHTAVKRWTQQVTDLIAQGSRQPGELARLEAVMNGLAKNYNEAVLAHSPNTPLRALNLGLPTLEARTPSQVVDVFEKFYDMVQGAGHTVRKQVAKVTKAEAKPLSSRLLATMQQFEKAIIGRKMLYGFAVTAATMVAYFASSMHAQSNNAYPANRLYRHGDAENAQGQSSLATGTRLSNTLESALRGHKLQHPTGVVS